MTSAVATEPLERRVNGRKIRLQKGDLTMLPVDAVVYYAREDLELGSGFGAAIQSRGGAAIKKELEAIGRIGMGEAVITSGGALPAGHIIHACGPKFQEPDVEPKLRQCMLAALEAAGARGLGTVAFPAMGAGFYGVPLEVCSTVMVETIRRFLERESALEEVVICVVDDREFRAFKLKLEAL